MAIAPLEAQAITANGTISELVLFRFGARQQETVVLCETLRPVELPRFAARSPLNGLTPVENADILSDCAMLRTDYHSPAAPQRGGSMRRLLLVLIVTAAAVYVWQFHKSGLPSATNAGPVSAWVVIRWPAEFGAASATRPIVAPDPKLLRQELISAANVRRALGGPEAGPASGTAAEDLAALAEAIRQDLRVAAQSVPGNGEVRVAISGPASNPHSATVINRLAEHYADQCHAKLQADAQQAYDAAHTASVRARQRSAAAKAKLDDYLSDALRNRPSAADAGNRSNGSSGGNPPGALEAGRELRLTTNPQWTALEEELQSLRQQRTERLSVRTPMHPEIVDLDERIAQAEKRFAATPPQIAAKPADLPVIVDGIPQPSAMHHVAAESDSSADPKRIMENAKALPTYRKLSDELAQAGAAVGELAAAESQARQEQQQLPKIEVFAAVEVAASAPRIRALLSPLPSALAAGLLMAVGAGLLLRGMPPARTFATANQVENALSLPVLGVLHEAGIALEGGRRELRIIAKGACAVLGTVMVAGCAAMLAGQIHHWASCLPWDLHCITDPLQRAVDFLSQKP